MFLLIRMLLYFAFSSLAALSAAVSFDPATELLTVDASKLANFLTTLDASGVVLGVGGFAATFFSSRVAKRWGWTT